MPHVPNAPGVPPLTSHDGGGGEPLATENVTQADAATSYQWGVFASHGDAVLEPDSFGGIEYSLDYRIADYPMESGQFGSYNKVATPWHNRVTVSKGGSLAERQAFETTLAHLAASLDLYNIVTPERAYLDCNITAVRLSRNAERGAGLLTYDIDFVQIRQTGEIQFDDDSVATAQPDSATKADAVPGTTKPAAPKLPVAKTPKSPAAARRQSRGSIQPKGPSRAEINRLKGLGATELPNGDLVLKL
jgi:hypothetical protein